jgi:hypothetical protein
LRPLLIKRPALKKKPFKVTKFFCRSETSCEAGVSGLKVNFAESIRRNAIKMRESGLPRDVRAWEVLDLIVTFDLSEAKPGRYFLEDTLRRAGIARHSELLSSADFALTRVAARLG